MAMAKLKRSTHRSSKGTKLYAVRESKSGRFMGIRIADPVGKPRGTTIKEIRKAVDTVLRERDKRA
jgi:hypothetical protein